MLTRSDALDFARSAGWVTRVPVKMRDALLAAARRRRFSAQARVLATGDGPGPVFFIAEGCLAAETAPSVNLPQTYMLMYPGTWSAEGALMSSDRVIRFVAKRPTTLLLVDNADLVRIAADQSEVWRYMALLAFENHYRTIGLAHELMIRGGRRRLAALLARLAGLRDEVVPHRLVIDATQSEIAEIANLARSVVSSFLKELERDGILRLGWSNIEILAPDRLLRIGDGE